MKFFSNTSFKSLAATAAALLFVSSAVYAACPPDCSYYASAKSGPVYNSVYGQAYNSCMNSAGYYGDPYYRQYMCQDAAASAARSAQSQAYSYYYQQCQSGNCV